MELIFYHKNVAYMVDGDDDEGNDGDDEGVKNNYIKIIISI